MLILKFALKNYWDLYFNFEIALKKSHIKNFVINDLIFFITKIYKC